MPVKDDNKKNRSFFKLDSFEKFRKFMKLNFYYNSISLYQLNGDTEMYDYTDKHIEKIVKEKYNDYIRIVKKIAEEKITFPRIERKQTIKYSVSQFDSNYNDLANSFQLKTIPAHRTCITIFILCLLSNGSMTKKKIMDNCYGDNTSLTITERINAMCEYGLISKDEGNNYSLNKNILYSIDDKLLLRLLNMTDFMKNLIYPEVSGYNLFNLLKKVYEDKTGKDYCSPFQFKYSHLATILDNNVLWTLIEAIEKRKLISFDYNGQKRKNILPVKIFTENEYDRQYLFAVYPRSSKIQIIRLSEIYNLKINATPITISDEGYNKYLELYENEKKYSFSGKIYNQKGKKPCTVRLIYKKNKPGLKAQIEHDFGNVQFLKENNEHIAVVKLKDKTMIKPYLRANMGIIKTTDEELSKEIDEEIEEMKKIYGIIQ